jgi:hypothetical protein
MRSGSVRRRLLVLGVGLLSAACSVGGSTSSTSAPLSPAATSAATSRMGDPGPRPIDVRTALDAAAFVTPAGQIVCLLAGDGVRAATTSPRTSCGRRRDLETATSTGEHRCTWTVRREPRASATASSRRQRRTRVSTRGARPATRRSRGTASVAGAPVRLDPGGGHLPVRQRDRRGHVRERVDRARVLHVARVDTDLLGITSEWTFDTPCLVTCVP